MAIAAVPKYLGTDFSTAAPGHRFGMYLKLWGVNSRSRRLLWTTHDVNYRETGPRREERECKDENKRAALKEAIKLNETDKSAMQALASRQRTLAERLESTGQLLRLEAVAIAPFATGLGNEHPLENGFAFLNPYGLPYLPGSGVKGVLRCAARELASGIFGGTEGWQEEDIDALLGRASESGETEHRRGGLIFWDVIPQINGDALKVDVMTPHQTHYYQHGESPHDSGSPNPISFLTVPPGSGFTFCVQCDRVFLERIAMHLLENDRWKSLIEAAFRHAFEWLGFGAKTAVGYGAMTENPQAMAERVRIRQEVEKQRLEAEQAKSRKEELDRMTPVERLVREFLDARQDQSQPEWRALVGALAKGTWSGSDKVEIAHHVKRLMQEAKRWKEKSEKKRPEKDSDYQDSLKVMQWIDGK